MSLQPGTRLGPYEIIAQIGVGGMGEVYRATDTNLKRSVAIKVLPESVAGDPERLARFQREAEVLAALNHPNIAQIHGLEKSDGQTALVMELVEGPTLADHIAQGAIPVDEALPIAKQIAEALEAAHEQGIIHRDLKPANIKLRPDGTVRGFRAVVLVLPGAVHHGRHDRAVRRRVAAQFIGDEPPRYPALVFQQLPKEARGGLPVASRLHEDVDHVAVLVHGAPQILPSALDRHEQLVQIPGVAHPPASAPQPPRVVGSEGLAPLPDRLVGDGDPAFGEKILDISKAEPKAVVQPDRVTDDLGGEAVAVVECGGARHRPTPPGTGSS